MIRIFLLAGQSNMAGAGVTAEVPEAFTCPANVRLFQEGQWRDLLWREQFGQLIPLFRILAKGKVHNARMAGGIRFVWLNATIVNGKLLKVGEDAQGQVGTPRITTHLKSGVNMLFDVDGGLFSLDKQFALAANAQ